MTQAQLQVTKVDPGNWAGHSANPPGAAEIHVWAFRSEVSSGLSQLEGLLSADEKQRAARFHFVRDSHRFTVTRGRTRSILAAYLQTDPRELQFNYSTHEKPSIRNPAHDLRFNVSHSGDRALLAVASAHEIGVDIEQVRSNVECEQLAERFFSEGERQLIHELDGDQKLASFFRLWTCKEAFLKAHGAGLSRSLSSFDVKLGTAPGQLLNIRGDAEEEDRWRLMELEAEPGYAAAVVVESELQGVRLLRLESE